MLNKTAYNKSFNSQNKDKDLLQKKIVNQSTQNYL